ncbi:MAG: hypothetical protein QXY45_02580, partial [Candidatus Aenigmatarchaeota archaeon]
TTTTTTTRTTTTTTTTRTTTTTTTTRTTTTTTTLPPLKIDCVELVINYKDCIPAQTQPRQGCCQLEGTLTMTCLQTDSNTCRSRGGVFYSGYTCISGSCRISSVDCLGKIKCPTGQVPELVNGQCVCVGYPVPPPIE